MSEKNRNKKSMLTDFLRYRRDEMTGEERNSFERDLQNDPFAEEAREGFASILPEDVSEDILRLQKRLKTRTDRRPGFIYYRIAASVAVLMVISTVFLLVERNKPAKQFTETAIQSEKLEIIENELPEEPFVDKEGSNNTISMAEKKTEKSGGQEIRMKTGKGSGQVADVKIADMRIIDSVPEIKILSDLGYARSDQISAPAAALAKGKVSSGFISRGKILSSEDNWPVPGASVSIKGTKTGVVTDSGGNFSIAFPDNENRTLVANFIGLESKEFEAKADSEVEVKLDPSISSLSEVVIVGYGISRAASDKKDESSGYVPPHPVNGKSAFDKYIQDNIQRPDRATAGQRVVVVVSFLVYSDGRVDSIKVVRSPGKPFSDEAIRLIMAGPSWKSAEENGKAIEDEVRVRIVFR